MNNHSEQTSEFEHPRNDQRIQHYLQDSEIIQMLISHSKWGYAGDAKQKRPLPQVSLYELKTRLNKYYQYRPAEYQECLYYAFSSDKYKVASEKSISVSREQMWWLVSPNDLLLLSDGHTDHYTSVARVDRDEGIIYFNDPWPDKFFLLEGRNVLGITARTGQGSSGLSITEPELSQVVVGLITFDTPALAQTFFDRFSNARDDIEVNLGFAHSILDLQRDLLLLHAEPYLTTALNLTEQNLSARNRSGRIASLIFMVLHVSFCINHADELQKALDNFVQAYSIETLLENLGSLELGRIGYWTLHLGLPSKALEFLDMALHKNPQDEVAAMTRAKVNRELKDFNNSLEDIDQALMLNGKRISQVTSELIKLGPGEHAGNRYDIDRIAGLKNRRLSELEMKLELLHQVDAEEAEIKSVSSEIEELAQECM